MSIRVELTYDMSKALGLQYFDLDSAATVRDVVEQTRARFSGGEEFGKLARVAAIAVNGVLINHRKGMKTKLADGDRVGFVKAADLSPAGGGDGVIDQDDHDRWLEAFEAAQGGPMVPLLTPLGSGALLIGLAWSARRSIERRRAVASPSSGS